MHISRKQWLLFFAGLFFIAGYFLLPENRKWTVKVLSWGKDFPGQVKRPTKEARFKERFGNSYTFSKNIADHFPAGQNALVLIPPTSYFKKRGLDYHVPEPAVFYYYTGLKTVWANSEEAVKAGWYVHVSQGHIVVDSVTNADQLRDSVETFKKMGVSL